MYIDKNIYAYELSDMTALAERMVKWCIENVWLQEFNLDLTTLPLLVNVESKGKRNAYGWIYTTMNFEKTIDGKNVDVAYSMALATEYIDRALVDTFITINHELCHLYNIKKGIKDTTAGQRHNMKFAAACDAIELAWQKDSSYGVNTHLPIDASGKTLQECWKAFEQEFKDNEIFTIRQKENGKKRAAKKKSASNQIKYVCGCCGKSFRATSKINAMCSDCNAPFVIEM